MEIKKSFPLFGKRVDLGSITYIIHGLVHDVPSISLSKEFKELINESLKDYTIICEDGFSEWINNSISFNETAHFNFDKSSLHQYIFGLKNYIYNFFIKKTQNSPFMQEVKQMHTLEELSKIRDILFKNYPLEPEGMNKILSFYNNGTILSPSGNLPLRIKRYIYEAKKSLEYTEDNKISELHIIVGCAHELPLEYLLKNRNILNNFTV